MVISSRRRGALGLAVLGISLLAGCETLPTQIDGREVVGSKVVNGERVYLVKSANGDIIETHARAAESRAVAKDIVFTGTATTMGTDGAAGDGAGTGAGK